AVVGAALGARLSPLGRRGLRGGAQPRRILGRAGGAQYRPQRRADDVSRPPDRVGNRTCQAVIINDRLRAAITDRQAPHAMKAAARWRSGYAEAVQGLPARFKSRPGLQFPPLDGLQIGQPGRSASVSMTPEQLANMSRLAGGLD